MRNKRTRCLTKQYSLPIIYKTFFVQFASNPENLKRAVNCNFAETIQNW